MHGAAQRLTRLPPLLHEPEEPPASRWEMPGGGPIDESGLVAIGADLQPGTLLAAYRAGLFPMPFDRRRVAWFSPDPRGVLPLDGLRMSRSLRRSMQRFVVGLDSCFADVVTACADPARHGAWIDPKIHAAYVRLHELGWAHSVEVFDPRTDALVGGLYGVRIGRLFAGESMFHRATDASKVALVHLVDWLRRTDATLLDVQWQTPHLASLGAVEISRPEYLRRLAKAVG
jgi:leucyl/phenylalanyl-tRNA--protein transferase